MELLNKLLDLVLHLNVHLDALVADYGPWVYALLFLIVFCETGLVVTPFLPGDSLLFAVGAIAAGGKLDVFLVSFLIIAAAILGDTVNYWVGRRAGKKLAEKYPRLIKPEHLRRTHEFFERYGGKTIVIARFVPIVRTFAPFVAGIGSMTYGRFMSYNVSGALLWVVLLVPAGYFFANVPFVQKNFSIVILAIIFLSILPAVFELFREWKRLRQERGGS
ncbi:MAG: DedA family protein [Verrucomicrobia bacterium]|nr:DedA family protein [Verrucomicrobiota bacterium]